MFCEGSTCLASITGQEDVLLNMTIYAYRQYVTPDTVTVIHFLENTLELVSITYIHLDDDDVLTLVHLQLRDDGKGVL